MAKTYKIAVIPGDGIGKEVTPWAQKALEKAAEGVADFEYENFDLGAERYLRDGAILPEDEEERIKANDAILLGAVGDPRIKAGILERGLLLKLRFDLDQYVNLRPSKLYKGVTSPLANPGDIDFVVVREGTEGLYCGAGGAVRRNTPQEVATEVSINTAYGVERVVRYAFKLAMKRKKHVTLVHKKNVLVNAGDMWQRIVDKVGEEYPEVTHDYQHIDAATIFLVSDPSRFDVILTDNLFGDILTDEAGSVVGSPDAPNIPASINTQTKQPDKSSEYRERWNALKPQLTVIHGHPRTPDEQMAIDETWAREVAAGTRQPTIRLWEWAGPAVVIGRFQSAQDEVNLDIAKQLGFDVVRRCTGGGAMFIEPGNTITYSLYAPLDFVQGVSIEESYRLCDWWLVEALRELGLDVRFAGLNDIASQYGKIGGAAQRRFPVGSGGAVLHHVTMAYDIDAAKMSRVLNTSREKMSDKAVKSAVKRVDPMKSQTGLSREHIVEHLIDWFAA